MAYSTTTVSSAPAIVHEEHIEVAWGAGFAGSLITLAVLAVCLLLGLGAAAAATDPSQVCSSLRDVATGEGVWAAFSLVSALFIGGGMAGRLARAKRPFDAAVHGMLTWAMTTLTLVVLLPLFAAVTAGGLGLVLLDRDPGVSAPPAPAKEVGRRSAADVRREARRLLDNGAAGAEAERPSERRRFEEKAGDVDRDLLRKEEARVLKAERRQQPRGPVPPPPERFARAWTRDIGESAGEESDTSSLDAALRALADLNGDQGDARERLTRTLEARGMERTRAIETVDRWARQLRDAQPDVQISAGTKTMDAETLDTIGGAIIVSVFVLVLGALAACIGAMIARPRPRRA